MKPEGVAVKFSSSEVYSFLHFWHLYILSFFMLFGSFYNHESFAVIVLFTVQAMQLQVSRQDVEWDGDHNAGLGYGQEFGARK